MEWTIAQLAPRIRKREVSPVEITRQALERIERLQPRLNAFITVTAELALEQARRAEKEISQGQYRGPLHGIPISLKDLFYTKGIRTTAGSKILQNFIPRENAAVVERLFQAGAVLVGKTNLHEFAFGATNLNPHYGPARNPWDRDRVSGGSSGGSAVAVAAGMGLASLGSDTGGSIRIPSAACGIVGLKPTLGNVSLRGVIPLAPTLDHVGPLCRCVEDAALIFDAIVDDATQPSGAGAGKRKPYARFSRGGLRGLRVGVPREYFFGRLQRDVRRCVLEAIQTMEREGAEIREVSLRRMRETSDLAANITVAEALAFHWQWFAKRRSDYGADLRERMTQSTGMTALVYLRAQEARRAYTEEFARALETVDVLAAPTLPVVAPRLDESEVAIGRSMENVRMALLRLTRPSNLTGFPAISVPCGFSADPMPVGLQLIGRRFGESTVLRAAWGYERATPWHTMFPPL